MRLRYSPTSPYVRKVTVLAIETGLYDAIELVPTNVWKPETDIASHNPLGKVPTLITEDGMELYDSPVICEYLDSRHDGPKLFPPEGPERWLALRRQALGDGLMDSGIAWILELRRPAEERSDAWIGRQKIVSGRVLDALDEEADSFGDGLTIGHIAIACALGHRDFRLAEENWRAGRPALADWFDAFSERRSMMETMPKERG